jgi:hypothetical protein
LKTKEILLYYQSQKDYGWLKLKYPYPDNSILSSLSTLERGGFIIIDELRLQGSSITEPISFGCLIELGEGSSHLKKRVESNSKGLAELQMALQLDTTIPITIACLKDPLLYAGLNNPIRITVAGVSPFLIRPRWESDGTLTRDLVDPSVFNAAFSWGGRPRKLLVDAFINGGWKRVAEMQYRVKLVPDPVLTLNGKCRGGDITRDALRCATGVVPLLENFSMEARIMVLGFGLMVSSHGKLQRLWTTGPLLTQEMKNAIAQVEEDDIVIFNNVDILPPDGVPRRLQGMTYVIVGNGGNVREFRKTNIH